MNKKDREEIIKIYLWLWNKSFTWNHETVFNSAEMLRHDGQPATLLTSWISCKPLLKNQNIVIQFHRFTCGELH